MPIASDRRGFFQLFYLFLGFASLFLILHFILPSSTVDFRVLLVGNGLLFILGLISLRMSMKALKHKNVQVFLQLVYGSFLLKFFVIAITAFIYIIHYKKNMNKAALIGCFGLYFLYMISEVSSVMKQSKKPNA
jgi:hypothetical protein